MNKISEIRLKCECGCSEIVTEIYPWEKEDSEVDIKFVDSRLNTKESKIKNVFKYLFSKPIASAEIITNLDEAEKFFKESLAAVRKEKKRLKTKETKTKSCLEDYWD